MVLSENMCSGDPNTYFIFKIRQDNSLWIVDGKRRLYLLGFLVAETLQSKFYIFPRIQVFPSFVPSQDNLILNFYTIGKFFTERSYICSN